MPSPTPHTIQRFRNRPASAAPSAGTVYSPNCAGAIEANDARTTAAPEVTSPASAQATTAERRGDQPSSSTPRSLSDPARSTSPARDQRKKAVHTAVKPTARTTNHSRSAGICPPNRWTGWSGNSAVVWRVRAP